MLDTRRHFREDCARHQPVRVQLTMLRRQHVLRDARNGLSQFAVCASFAMYAHAKDPVDCRQLNEAASGPDDNFRPPLSRNSHRTGTRLFLIGSRLSVHEALPRSGAIASLSWHHMQDDLDDPMPLEGSWANLGTESTSATDELE